MDILDKIQRAITWAAIVLMFVQAVAKHMGVLL